MAYDLVTLVSRVQKRIRDTGYSSAEIIEAIDDAQNDVFNEYRLRFMRTSQNYTMAVGVADIANGAGLPTNLSEAISLSDTTSGQPQTIEYIDYDLLEELYPDPQDSTLYANGQPLYWYWDGPLIKTFPAPAAAYTMKLRFWKSPTELTTGNQVPEIPAPFKEVLLSGAAYRIFQVKDMYDIAGVHQNKYDEILAKLVMRYALPQTGTVHRMAINRRQMIRRSSWRR